MQQAHGRTKLLLGHLLHADQEPAAMPIAPLPSLDKLAHLSPAAQVEVADAEVRPLGKRERFPQSWQQRLVDIVEDARHGATSSSFLTTFAAWSGFKPSLGMLGGPRGGPSLCESTS